MQGDLIRWEYAGIEFRVSPALTPDQRDGVCSVLLADYDHRNRSVSDYSQEPSKPIQHRSKVIDRPEPENVLEAHTDPLDEILTPLNECRVCGKVIQPTGKRGRPRKIHEACK